MTDVTEARNVPADCIHIGLVNNMPDAALDATARQFRTLLSEAAEGIAVRLSLFALPEVPRSEKARSTIASSYTSISALWDTPLDGLIVTGTDPVARNLVDEPYWAGLTQLIEWAEHNTHSSVWSCLAAHAAVLHMDGIDRRRFGEKLFGVFPCASSSDHLLTSGVPAHFAMPHSRWNDIPEDALCACGYRILTRLHSGAVDAFVKEGKHLFLFFQGHPEYEAVSLLLEYRRDVRRFLNKETDLVPSMPHGYFDENAIAALNALRERALSRPREESLADFAAKMQAARVQNTWRSHGVLFYRNWLRYLSEQRNMAASARRSGSFSQGQWDAERHDCRT